MTEEEKVILNKTVSIERLIKGIWLDTKTNETWSFFEIGENERVGNVLIAGTGNPAPGRFMQYEVIWVNDNNIFIDLIWLSIAFRTQHQIWINEKSMRIAFINNAHQKQQYFYVDLIKG